MSGGPPYPYTVVYDADALHDFNEEVKSRGERLAVANAVDKLRRLGEQLVPPHMKPLKGYGELRELRPRQGRSPTRPLYRRFGDSYVILAIAVKDDFEKKASRAQERARQYE
jgi:hypothetical protein